jgi:hypothetical protein
MTTRSRTRKITRWFSYGVQRFLLQLYGPADTQGKDHPVRMLKLKYNREPDEFEGFHIENKTD